MEGERISLGEARKSNLQSRIQIMMVNLIRTDRSVGIELKLNDRIRVNHTLDHIWIGDRIVRLTPCSQLGQMIRCFVVIIAVTVPRFAFPLVSIYRKGPLRQVLMHPQRFR
ncbi:MAG: hypothetical protein JWN70_4520 [Planctomycetaceae bacterium]|nr:hypothetical protein [Planctomycetaceae bacterium]